MCGIAGLIWKAPGRPADIGLVEAMSDVIAYRGPDDKGSYACGSVALVHRRLSILDLSQAGQQPMVSADGRLVIVFNGEIYNYLELREELERHGSQFRSHTDTEVILEAYSTWGANCVSRFNGMWAFAIHDKGSDTIFLSRDRFGIKPLYYVDRADCFGFSSEIKAILAAFQDERRVNFPYLYHFLPSGALDDGEETFFENVKAFLPAHSGHYDINARTFRMWRYWDLDHEAFRTEWGNGDPVETMWGLINSSVKLQLRSDVPVGTCLSGGVDSSTIVGLTHLLQPKPMHTFSGLYPDKDCDEREYVSAVNDHTGAISCAVYPEPGRELVDVLSKITWHQDEPTAGPGLITQYYVMKEASRHVKVVLDGQGSDELLAGYLPYFALHLDDLISRGGVINRARALRLAAEVSWQWGSETLSGAWDKLLGASLSRVARLLARRRRSPGGSEPPVIHPALVMRCNGRQLVRDRPKRLSSKLGDTLYWHLVQQSIPALLHYEDRNSMAFSIEARVPFLDHRIVEFALALDDSYKIRGSWTKWVLRRSAERVVPKKVAWRRSKMGYPTPFARWLREEPNRSVFRELLFSSSFLAREIVNADALRFYWDQHQAGGVDRSWLLYRYATIELWFRQYIDSWAPNPAHRN